MAKYGKFKYSKKKYGQEKWIYDRSQADLDADSERVYINYWDLNRIETSTQELADAVPDDNEYKWVADQIKTKTDWEKVTASNYTANTPISTETHRIINNILMLWMYPYEMENSPYASHRTKIPSSMRGIDIYDMNNIELALYYMYLNTNNMRRR